VFAVPKRRGPSSRSSRLTNYVDQACPSRSVRAGDPAAHFNGYAVTIRFSPEHVAFRSVAGALMVAGAPSRFKVTETTDSTVTYTHVLLGAGLFVSGPGELSRFTFLPLDAEVSSLDVISDPHCTFYDGGLCVNDDEGQALPRTVTLEGAVVAPAGASGAVEADVPSSSGLRFVPNPWSRSAGSGELLVDVRREGPIEVRVSDVAGRCVTETGGAGVARGMYRWRWDGVGRRGGDLAAGVYFVRVEDALGARSLRVVRIP
jgi:hypothetical protein